MDKDIKIGIAVIIGIALITGAYLIGQKSNTSSQQEVSVPNPTSSEVTAQTQPSTANNQTAEDNTSNTNNDLFNKQQTCSQILNNFEEEQQSQYTKLGVTSFTLTNFVVGYSPILNVCVGGYNAVSQPGGNFAGILSQYTIINLNTNQALAVPGEGSITTYIEDSNPSYPNHQYQQYLNELSYLTNGEIH